MGNCTIGYGKVNFPNASMSIMCTTLEKPFVTKLPKFQQASPIVAIPSSARPDITGTVYLHTMNIPDGTLMMLKAGKTYKGRAIADAALFLRPREGAAMIRIDVLMPESGTSLLPNSRHLCFHGEADLLDADEVVREHGIAIRNTFRSSHLDPEEQGEIFRMVVERGAVAPKPKTEVVTNSDGKEVVLAMAERTRRVRVRRD